MPKRAGKPNSWLMETSAANATKGSGNPRREGSASRGKWMLVIVLLVLGTLIGLTVLPKDEPSDDAVATAYESEARILVRHHGERSAPDSKDAVDHAQRFLETEIAILTSMDVAMRVAEEIGPDRLVPENEKADAVKAAAVVVEGLQVEARPASDILILRFRHANPALAPRILQSLVDRYFERHLEIHRSDGLMGQMTRQADQAKTRVEQTREDLGRLRAEPEVDETRRRTLDERLMKEESEAADLLSRLEETRKQLVANLDAMPRVALIQRACPAVEVRSGE